MSDTENKEENKELHFKTNVQLKSIIGKDLINDDNIAILELVKNSFDADAKKVTVRYLNLKENDDKHTNTFTDKTSRLIIKDNGVGMNLQEIEEKWLNIAFSEKKTNKNQYQRRMAGAKGVGRFSCDRLGQYLNLYTKKKGSSSYIKLTIDWKLFEVEDNTVEIQSIPLHYEYLNDDELADLGFESFEQGVLLEIIKLRSFWVYPVFNKQKKFVRWDLEKLIDLKKYLEKLINPNQAFENDDFGIFIDTPEFIKENSYLDEHEKFIGQVKNRIFDKLDFKSTSIESYTQEEGKIIYTELKDKGQTVFWIKEENPYYPYIKNVNLTVYYLNPYAKAFFTKQTGIQSVNYGSIFLFINGFRISPYGDVGNDWLGLDQRKAQGTRRYLGLRDIVGQIEITDDSNDFQIISSREGIVRNDHYKKLTNSERNDSFFYKALRRIERYVVDGLDWDSSIYDNKNAKFKELEQKIITGNTTEDDLLYREDEDTKQRRIYKAIHSIISAKSNEVIELYINEGLITHKIDEEKERSEREFEQLLDDFEHKKIDADTLNRVLQRKALKNKELEKQIKDFSRYSTNEATSKAILELQDYRKRLSDQSKLINQLQRQLEILDKEKAEAEKKIDDAQAEADNIRKELNEVNSQNLFLKSIKSQDFNEVLNLMHHIGISTSTIQNYIKGATFKIDNNIDFEKDELKGIFSKLSYELNKIYSISKFATKANFKVETKDTKIDIVNFIEEYLFNVVKPFLSKSISLIIYEHDLAYQKFFKPMELIIVIDNLISNARKAMDAKEKKLGEPFDKKIEISFEKVDGQLCIVFKDNGIGMDTDAKNKIFDYGYTTTDGSGLGLTHVRDLLKRFKGEIELKSSQLMEGTEFLITINQ